MIVVSDATPLISLMKIGHLDLLQYYFGEVQIPPAVYNELITNTNYQDEANLIKDCPFIHIVKLSNYLEVNLIRKTEGLDLGESEAIVLSNEIKAELLLMDELKGRQVAEQMGIRIMGTIGLLLASYEKRYLSPEEIRECVCLLKTSGRHIGERYFNLLLDRIEKF